MRFSSTGLAMAICLTAAQAYANCTLSFTSPSDGTTVRTPIVTVFGSGGVDAKNGAAGTVTATLNGQPFFTYSGSFTTALSFFRSRGATVTLRPGNNYLNVTGRVGSCSASDSMTLTYDPELIQTKNKGRPEGPGCQGNPINIAVGNKFQAATDFELRGAVPLVFQRFYNSLDGYWRHNYSTRLVIESSGVKLIHGDGREAFFNREGSAITPEMDELGRLSRNGNEWVYLSEREETYKFDHQGRLIRWQSINGLGYDVTYNSDDSILVQSDPGQSLRFTQDDKFQPLTLTVDTGSVTYSYDDTRRLTRRTSRWGGESQSQSYLYENPDYPRFLTGILDENGARYASWDYDAQGRATSSYHGSKADKVTVVYNNDGTTRVTNALGKQTVYHYTVVNGVRKVTRIDGQPSPNCPASNASYTYNDRGLISTHTDNNGAVTVYEYNDRGLEIQKTEAQGTAEERIILTEWHRDFRLPIRITEPSRVMEYHYDKQGRLLSQKLLPRS